MQITITTPDGLDVLTVQINDAIERRERSKDEWAEATADLCLHLAKARAKFKDDIGFGKWFKASGFQLNDKDRAAAITMGKEIDVARQVLQSTKRNSLQLIELHEFRSVSTNKPADKPKKPAKPKTTPELEEALHAYDRRKLAGEDLTYEAIMEEAGVSSTPVRRAIAQRRAEEQIDSKETTDLSMSAKQKLEAAISHQIRRLELEAETKARQEARRIVDELSIPNYLETLRKVERMLEWKRGVMSRPEYRKIIRCLHPDTGAHVSDENRNEAFRLFTQYEARLVDDKEQADLKRVSTLPRTVEEMLARKGKK